MPIVTAQRAGTVIGTTARGTPIVISQRRNDGTFGGPISDRARSRAPTTRHHHQGLPRTMGAIIGTTHDPDARALGGSAAAPAPGPRWRRAPGVITSVSESATSSYS